MIFFETYENPETSSQLTVNKLGYVLQAIALIVALFGIVWGYQHTRTIVDSQDAGTFVSATVGSGKVNSFVVVGLGTTFASRYTTVTTTKGVFTVDGIHAFAAGEPVAIQVARNGIKKLCTASLCGQIVR